jgi:hypothetical protein
MKHNFRDIVPKPDDPRVAGICDRDAYQHIAQRLTNPRIKLAVEGWMKRFAEPFRGITTDGNVVPGLFHLAGEDAPSEQMVAAARQLLSVVNADEARLMRRSVVSEHWRIWSNPELYVNHQGLRLDEIRGEVRDAILEVLRACMSAKGCERARNCMRMNHVLGEVVNARKVMNEFSYNFLLYGEPSPTEPWGWNFYGHHLCLNCFVIGRQMVISPTFMGAEPNIIDEGPWKGLTIFTEEEEKGLALMRSLPAAVRDTAQVYKLMKDPAMPEGRWHPADQRHLGGAFHDNRVIPYEGVRVTEFSAVQQKHLLDVAQVFLSYLPPGPLSARMAQLERHLPDTRFAWIGGYGDDDTFYYKIHSPVMMIEFDHHSGVFLTNEEPWKCHIHTVVRTPNGNDYGKDLLRQHYDHVHPGHLPGGRKLSHA